MSAVIDGLMALVTFALMWLYGSTLALITIGAVACYTLLRVASFTVLRARSELQMEAAAKEQSYLLETLRGMQSLKIQGIEAARGSTYAGHVVETANQSVGIAKLGLGLGAANQIIFGVERVAVVLIGATLAIDNVFSVGMLIAYLGYKDQFAGRITALIDAIMSFRMLSLHRERLADIVLTEPEPVQPELPFVDAPAEFSIRVDALRFRYAQSEPVILDGVSFRVSEGECVAIIGASGCGKTTLVKLLLGLLVPESGAIEVGHRTLNQWGLRNYRRWVSAVMQEDQLFAGSLADNIALGDEQADLRRVEAASRLAAIHDEIEKMPMGYHTLVGDMGTVLSGGQKQRVLLARALYRKPRLLVLDEATSHLDVHREKLVNAAIKRVRLTKIIIAHRPETIASADRVLVMEQGRIVREFKPHRAARSEATT